MQKSRRGIGVLSAGWVSGAFWVSALMGFEFLRFFGLAEGFFDAHAELSYGAGVYSEEVSEVVGQI